MSNLNKPEKNRLCSLIGHKFGQGDKPCVCSRCGVNSGIWGPKIFHQWEPQLMDKPSPNYCGVNVCKFCGMQGELLPHDYSRCRCRRCGAKALTGHTYELYRITSRIVTNTHTEYCTKDRTDDYICNFCTSRDCVREVTEKKKVTSYWYRCTICGNEIQTGERQKNASYIRNKFIDNPTLEEEPPVSEE